MNRTVVLEVSISALVFSLVCSGVALAGAVDDYEGHKILLWAIDHETGQVRGFASGVVKLGGKLALEPVAGHPVTFQWGTRWGKSSRHTGAQVSMDIRHTGGGAGGGAYLLTPRWFDGRAHGKGPNTIVFMATLGTMRSARLRRAIAGPFEGTRGEIEDLAMECVLADEATDITATLPEMLKETQRRAEWRKLLEDDRAWVVRNAAIMLARLGDPEGEKAFLELCRTSRGNVLVRLADELMRIPATDASLEVRIDLARRPEPLVLDYGPDIAVGDVDRRPGLLKGVLENYPYNEIEGRLRAVLARPDAGAVIKYRIREYLAEHEEK
jgi:hypothetical protein